ncbi:hypothetical protein CcaverHIS002_0505450 [Cutaneotrichosporon cavernicola]|uniref:Phosducin domain-containing protein n=1 Tax=Cutaneotrichosporon cavernicola TaxID=279322 RepID=A0AA48QWX7_9TREE|nr:uncharacterized protein CcaverHIS019_0505970 [Cutaneotrichosporon cavernicola]BEI85144.1 hypothetical protein CcaverHIS002_0505450 [Cutaneotrichosporon cavernicola]BEI92969.1 hypothetical protein CcaverHIS019_0505970 [Cutaneotrichosporon cavernicola]BEJ00745.1 hypothetical protein CcaverHIS631_0506020 [Cutaneotrichosporon cavernicola]BEJ08511.1 hypothetical protein CcaverHIS641_0506050 [Cutaneotrichosporon cavernicola]
MVNPNEDTEFNDALRAQGILPPKPPSRSPSPDIPHITRADATRALAEIADADQLGDLLEGDGLDSDDERMFEDYRRKRMAEMHQAEKRGRFGSMEPLAREDFVREVTDASKAAPPGEQVDDDSDDEAPKKSRGTGVVVFLFQDSIPLSQHFRPLLNQIAAAHPETKFLAIPAQLCIPNYPDKNVPTLLVYRNGEMMGQVVAGAGLKGMKTTARDLEALLIRYTALSGPSKALRVSGSREEDSDDDLDDDIGAVNTRGGGIRSGGVGVGTRRDASDDDDSDFDM